MRKVRTTMEPHREIEVSDQEALDLKRQGLLAPEATEAKPATKTKGDDK